LSLFAAGIVLFVLLIASYSRRSTWLALGSIALSMALLFGCLFLVTIHDRSHVRTRLAWVADKLPLVLDQQTATELAASLERLAAPSPSPCSAGQPGCGPETAAAAPRIAAPKPEPVEAAAAANWFAPKPAPKAASDSPVVWHLDDRDDKAPVTSPWGFSLDGTNVSDQALEQVEAVLKPDSSNRAMKLAVSVEGDDVGDGSVIPADARFTLFSTTPDDGASALAGGAILSFRYVQAGQRKSSIVYLTPAMVARFANR
jgi:hypothetical protein